MENFIFPTIRTIKGNYTPDYRFAEDLHTTPILRDIVRRLGMPNAMLSNFMTVVDPYIEFVQESYEHLTDYLPLGSRTRMAIGSVLVLVDVGFSGFSYEFTCFYACAIVI